jgi:hypothetical protein
MKKSTSPIPIATRVILLACLAGISAAPAVRAQQVTLYQDTSNYSYGDGGEFNAVPDVGLLSLNPTLSGYAPGVTAGLTSYAGGANFQTFCVETEEYFTPGNTYNVAVSDSIKYDGGQFLPNGEPLTLGAAWLYSQFAAGTLGGYDYTEGSGRTLTAGALQQALWYLQGEVGSLVNGGVDGTAFYDEAQTALAGMGESVTNNADGAFSVHVLNLTSSDGNDQDQLMVVPGYEVPEPSALSLGLLGLLLPGLYRARTFFGKQKA